MKYASINAWRRALVSSMLRSGFSLLQRCCSVSAPAAELKARYWSVARNSQAVNPSLLASSSILTPCVACLSEGLAPRLVSLPRL